MSKVLILQSQSGDWEGLFIDDVLVDEGHSLGEGTPRHYWISKAVEYKFGIEDIVEKEVNDKDELYLYKYGSFPNNINELDGNYGE